VTALARGLGSGVTLDVVKDREDNLGDLRVHAVGPGSTEHEAFNDCPATDPGIATVGGSRS
jgi:hypothetical protein